MAMKRSFNKCISYNCYWTVCIGNYPLAGVCQPDAILIYFDSKLEWLEWII